MSERMSSSSMFHEQLTSTLSSLSTKPPAMDDLAFGADGLLQQRVRERHVLVARHLGHLAEGRREGLVHEVLAHSQVHLLRVEPGDDLPALQDLGLLPGKPLAIGVPDGLGLAGRLFFDIRDEGVVLRLDRAHLLLSFRAYSRFDVGK